MTSGEADTEGLHYVRGVLVSIVLGPVLIAGGILIATAAISTLVAGWTPSSWFSGNAADWLVGGGAQGDAANYVRMLVGAVLAGTSWTGIHWAFTGSAR